MATKYKICGICGSQHPLGHPCMSCSKRGLKGQEVTPDQIVEYVKILRLHKNDIIVFKGLDDMSEPDMQFFWESIADIEVVQKKNIQCIFIPKNGDIVILRDR